MNVQRSRESEPAAGRTLAALLAAALLLAAVPAPAGAQTQTITRRQLTTLLGDTARRVAVVTPTTGQVDTAATGAAVRLDASQILAARTGDEVERVRTPPSRFPSATPTDPAIAPPAVQPRPDPAPPPTDPRVTADATTFHLPFRYVTVSPEGDRLLALRPIIEALPLRYDPAEGMLRGRFLVGLHDLEAPQAARTLGNAVSLQLISGVDSLEPTLLQLARTSIPYQEVLLATRQDSDSVHVRIIPEFDPQGVDLWLPAAPWIELVSAAPGIAGLGVQSTALTVRLRGSGEARRQVALSASRGTLEPSQFELAPGEAVTVRLRSAGIGPASIMASGSGLGRAETTIGFGWPLLFAIAALFGGAVGGLASGLHARDGRHDAGVLAHVKLGIVSGLMAAVAYFAIGLNLIGLDFEVGFFNEAAVFTIAMLAGAIGLPVLWALRKGRPAQE